MIYGKASSFADPGDIRAFRRCKERGGTDEECFKVGDNGIGYWGDDTSEGSGLSCAVPPDYMIERWGSVRAAKHKKIRASVSGIERTLILKDRMKWLKNIHNGTVIDLNPDACAAFGLKPPVMIEVAWDWAE